MRSSGSSAIVLALVFGEPKDQTLVTDLKEEDSTIIADRLGGPDLRPGADRGGDLLPRVHVRRVPEAACALVVGRAARRARLRPRPRRPPAPIQLIALGAFGVGLCLLYWRTQSIIPCMALHALNNSITFGATKDLDAGAVRRRRGPQRRHRDRRRHRRLPPVGGGRMRRSALALLGVLALPATAAAQTPPAPTPTPPPAVPTPAPPPPAAAKLSVSAQGGLTKTAALAARAFTARVVMKPYVANETAVLRVYRGHKKIKVKTLDVQAGRRRGVGRGRVQGQLEVGRHGDAEGVAPRDPWPGDHRRQAGQGQRRQRVRRAGLQGAAGQVAAEQAGLAALRHVALGRLRRRHRAGDHGLAQGRRLLAHLHRDLRRVRRDAQGPRRLQGPSPQGRPPRRGAPEPAGPGADQRLEGRADLPHVLREARRRRPSRASSAST